MSFDRENENHQANFGYVLGKEKSKILLQVFFTGLATKISFYYNINTNNPIDRNVSVNVILEL